MRVGDHAHRPCAAPGGFVDVRVRPSLCDDASSGIAALPSDHEVTLLFAPPGEARRAIILTTDAWSNVPATKKTP